MQSNMMNQNKPMTEKLDEKQMIMAKEVARQFHGLPSSMKNLMRENSRSDCEKFFETKEYKSGDTNYDGYVVCCDMLELCGGLSWWVILFIIVAILCCCASSAAAFFFFYWNRKRGGKNDEISVKEDDNTESTKSGDDVKVENGKK